MGHYFQPCVLVLCVLHLCKSLHPKQGMACFFEALLICSRSFLRLCPVIIYVLLLFIASGIQRDVDHKISSSFWWGMSKVLANNLAAALNCETESLYCMWVFLGAGWWARPFGCHLLTFTQYSTWQQLAQVTRFAILVLLSSGSTSPYFIART